MRIIIIIILLIIMRNNWEQAPGTRNIAQTDEVMRIIIIIIIIIILIIMRNNWEQVPGPRHRTPGLFHQPRLRSEWGATGFEQGNHMFYYYIVLSHTNSVTDWKCCSN